MCSPNRKLLKSLPKSQGLKATNVFVNGARVAVKSKAFESNPLRCRSWNYGINALRFSSPDYAALRMKIRQCYLHASSTQVWFHFHERAAILENNVRSAFPHPRIYSVGLSESGPCTGAIFERCIRTWLIFSMHGLIFPMQTWLPSHGLGWQVVTLDVESVTRVYHEPA